MSEPLTEETVRHVAHLARLEMSDDDVSRYREQLAKMIEYVHQLDEPDTEDVLPTAHPLPISNVFREDVIQPPWSAKTALMNAPQQHESMFQVPRVLDQGNA